MAQLITANNIDPTTLNVIQGPRVSNIQYPGDDTAASVAGSQTVTLIGAGFQAGATVYVDNVAVGVTSVISGSVLSFVTPAKSPGNYPLYVVNADGGTATFLAGIQYSGVPTWITGSGSLGTVYETETFNYSLSANSDSTVSYTVTSGTLAAGAILNASTGSITGNANLVAGSTTYNFTVDAVDQEQQNTSRNFSITVNPDVVTFNSPANNSLYSGQVGDPLIVSMNATSVLGKTITYSANSLPNGLSISGNLISGNYTTVANSTTVVTATSTGTNKTSNITLNWSVVNPPITTGQIAYTTPGTYSFVIPAGITSVSAVLVAGGSSSKSSNSFYKSVRQSGGGGGLRYINGLPVTPGETITVIVGNYTTFGGSSADGDSSLKRGTNILVYAQGASYTTGGTGSDLGSGAFGGTIGGGNGGNGNGVSNTYGGAGGGGAGGYSGNGGVGGIGGLQNAGTAGAGGGGGGGGGSSSSSSTSGYGGGGGGVGIYGQGSNGAGGAGATNGNPGAAGGGGSGGTNGVSSNTTNPNGGLYGGGGGGQPMDSFSTTSAYEGIGGTGAVRIIWGDNRAFPSTNTGDL